jgi:hypothetical protein
MAGRKRLRTPRIVAPPEAAASRRALSLLTRRRNHPGDSKPRLDAVGHGAQLGVVRLDRQRLAAGVAQQRDVLVGAAGVGHARDRAAAVRSGGECVENRR